jgi:hypothetical protein
MKQQQQQQEQQQEEERWPDASQMHPALLTHRLLTLDL